MIGVQTRTVNSLLRRGFNRAHKRDGEAVYLWKRVNPWHQVIAQVSSDGTVNGGNLSDFLKEGIK